ncbi:DUF3800 domain-containing protein [Rhodopseudomonas sp. HC1]|uniref:DUF3800 domain-containing protein n=1 Tax=Rhodopseudomonas infernalis TaxID=2897386 RepID=UPI001EE85601|nr:DUF3800 domain-containing protein [Rhodopseudomonas infernalis]MCG6203011.1 DUF3800 domain-containing protein [Rhodopseudomonas infernalis]
MLFVYLDEFGHVGPYFSRAHPKFNSSPIFGIGGIIFPEEAIRPFASFFLQRKEELLNFEIKKSKKPAYEWEKHGSNLYTAKSIVLYPEIRQTTFRILNRVRKCGGKIFYHGREKITATEDVNPNGLYKTVFSDAIRKLEAYCAEQNKNFVIVVDEHSARRELLETAVKTMYGRDPARHLASPPFEVESHLNQNIQAADWIAAIIGKLWTYRLGGKEWTDLRPYDDYFWTRIHSLATHSTVLERPRKKATTVSQPLISETVVEIETHETAISAAFRTATIRKSG